MEYGKLMKYKPTPTEHAYCYDGPLALRQFGPDPNDAADVLETYPWCASQVLLPCVPQLGALELTGIMMTRLLCHPGGNFDAGMMWLTKTSMG